MVRRLVIALVAVLLAAVGGVLTFLYAQGADARAMAGMSPTQVLVVAEPIPAGTPAESIGRSVVVSELPSAAVIAGGVTDLADISGLLTSTDLQPGEQLLASRFIAPEAVPDEVEVPLDMHQLTIRLETQRVIGGTLAPGDTVALFASGTLTGLGPDGSGSESLTRLLLHKVLVTAVQGAASTTTNEEGEVVEEGAADQLMVTLALSAPDAEQVVFAQEFGSIWLSLEGENVPEQGTRTVDAEVMFG